jgi:uncharacterized membrane protein YsdA (DUF1294 family)/cold shock CspA family protein
MEKKGTVVRWDAARAFGFIRSPDSQADVFFHVRDFRGGHQHPAPREGLAVVYEEIHVGGKGPRAMAVRPGSAMGSTMQSQPLHAPSSPSRGGSAGPSARSAPAHTGGRTAASTSSSSPSPRHGRGPRRSSPSSSAPMPVPVASSGLASLLMAGWAGLLAWGLWTRQLPLWVLGAAVVLNLLTIIVYAMDKNAAQTRQWRTSEKNLHLLALAGGWPGAWWAQQLLRHKTSKAEFRCVYWLTVVLNCAGLWVWVQGVPKALQSFL